MGIGYERRSRAEQLRHTADDRLIGYALSESDLNFEKHGIEDVAEIVNRQLDRAEQNLRKAGRFP